ncbi:hypothetical protein HN954_00870 [bacterium]|jgi:hypothetical protein|nr:hypothetical protein [bacterium]MBT6831876.1 hypothetical protein [bacterium]MBT6995966.1 hypothetical protein [bacterium]MBT7772241.1 hypothetical protein [bacterium]
MFRIFFLTLLVFFISAVALVFTVLGFDPLGTQQVIAFSAFFFSLFLVSTTFFSFVFFFGAELFFVNFFRQFSEKTQFSIALRRGILMAIFISVTALLQLFRIAGVLEIGLLVLFLAVVEMIFLSPEPQK